MLFCNMMALCFGRLMIFILYNVEKSGHTVLISFMRFLILLIFHNPSFWSARRELYIRAKFAQSKYKLNGWFKFI